MTAAEQRTHRIGLLLVAGAALAWSSAGLFVRTIEADLFTMLFWRGLFSGSAVFLLFVLIERGRTLQVLRGLGWPALWVALFSASGMICGIGAIRFTAVADAMVNYATVPFVTAGVAFAMIGERPSRSTILASLAALFGVAIMMWGAEWGSSLLGKLLAVGMTLSMAGMAVMLRRHREVPMLPAIGASAWICSAVCFWWAAPMSISATDLALVALFGVVQNALGLALYTFGSKRVPAAEATLLAALEVPFTPLWVFLFLGETPPVQTLIGGAVVLAAMFAHILAEFRGRKAVHGEPFSVPP